MRPRRHRKAQNPQSGGGGSHSGHRPGAGHTPPCMPRAELKGALCGGTGRARSGEGDGTSMQLSRSTGAAAVSADPPSLPSASVSSSLSYTLLSTPFLEFFVNLPVFSLCPSPYLELLVFLPISMTRVGLSICPDLFVNLSPCCPFLSVCLRASAMLPLPSPALTGILSFLVLSVPLSGSAPATGHARRG